MSIAKVPEMKPHLGLGRLVRFVIREHVSTLSNHLGLERKSKDLSPILGDH